MIFCSDVSYMTSYLPGGHFKRGVATEKVTTVLGNLNLLELCNGISKTQMEKEKLQYFSCQQIMKMSPHMIFPEMIVSSNENDKTHNGKWLVQSWAGQNVCFDIFMTVLIVLKTLF